jgi:Terminase large subunit, ATPase domain
LAAREFIDKVYGTPTRRAILSMGRKNGKSAITAMLLLVHLAGPEARQNSQIYSAAQSRDQATLAFGLAAKIVRMSPKLSDKVTIRDSVKVLFGRKLGVTYRALSADATTAYGHCHVNHRWASAGLCLRVCFASRHGADARHLRPNPRGDGAVSAVCGG